LKKAGESWPIFIFSLAPARIFLRLFYLSIYTLIIWRLGWITKAIVFSHFPRGNTDGYRVFAINSIVFCGDRVPDRGLRFAEKAIMSWLYWLSGSLALTVFIYLLAALFYPEKF